MHDVQWPIQGEHEIVAMPHGGLGVMPEAWQKAGKPAWVLEMICTGWRRCPDGVWRFPRDWPRLREGAA